MNQASAETSQVFTRRVIFPLSALVVMLLIFAVGGIFWTADYQTRIAIAQQARLASGALRIHAEKLAVSANDYGYWDEAVTAVEAPDYQWMKDNIGTGAAKSLGTDMAFVIDANGHTIFSYVNKTDATPDTVVAMPMAFLKSYDNWKARAAGASYSGLQPFADSAVAIAIAPVRSSTDAEKPPTGYAIVFVDLVDTDLLTDLARDFELANFRSVKSDADISDNRALITLGEADRKGAGVARFTWDAQKPGNGLLQIALPFIAIFLLALSLLAAMLLRYLATSARIINDRETKAYCDPLTGLANRTRFFSELERCIEQIVPSLTGVVVMYLDLDGFKKINDTMGHSAGDELLVQAAQRFKSCMRDSDLVARIGGDEFAIIMSGRIEKAHIQAVGARILIALAEPFHLTAGLAEIGCSIGIADCWQRGIQSADLLNRADKALYQVKASGKNALRFADEEPADAGSRDDLMVA
jgi:diguanylate cyclase (GGDEF)-like protein